MTYAQAVALGLVQGLTEFLPVSSSAHLALTPWLFGWSDPGLTIDVALHVGTLVAVAGYFWRDWLRMTRDGLSSPRTAEGRLFWIIAAASVPAAAAGLVLEKAVEGAVRSPAVIAVVLMAFGALFEAADRWGRRSRPIEELSWGGGLAVGCAQALALVPGVSRSGVTMTAGLSLGLTREAAARYSFLLSAPITFGAAVFKLRHLHAADVTGPFVAGVAVSAVSGALAIGLIMRLLPKTGARPYFYYRLALGGLILALHFSR